MSSLLNKKYWLWFPGDFEIHHGLKQNFEREERSYAWPAYWYMDDCHRNVCFTNEYILEAKETFQVTAKGIGHVEVNGEKYAFEDVISCGPGAVTITISCGSLKGLPCIFIEGKTIKSDSSWQVSNFLEKYPVGFNKLYTSKEKNPNVIDYQEERVLPVNAEVQNSGVLFDFGRVVNGSLLIKTKKVVTLCYGESQTEALDVVHCYHKQEGVTPESEIRKRAFRYIYIPDLLPEEIEIVACHQYLSHQYYSEFHTNHELINRIWKVASTTFSLCSNLFFIDGIKRDCWIWSGDTYQSILINQYCFFDEDINRRTLLALRGQNEIKQHINTIVDYSLLWLISIEAHYQMTNDVAFLKNIFPKMTSMIRFLQKQVNEQGFIFAREQDWIFIDWAELDKTGPICAEQILLWKAYQVYETIGKVLGKPLDESGELSTKFARSIREYYWDDSQNVFIDSYESGRKFVSRQTNIFALLFDFATEDEKVTIIQNVLKNAEIPEITTPYFKFYELDVLARTGDLQTVWQTIQTYWGGMIKRGAKTFWEEYNPNEIGDKSYEMYGDPYGKSLCHAWGASPIYLLAKYFVGLKTETPGYEKFSITPAIEYLSEFSCELPINNGVVTITCKKEQLKVKATKDGGVLKINQQQYLLPKNETVVVDLG